MKKMLNTLAAFVAAVGFLTTGCGPASSDTSSATLSGVASTTQAVSSVTIKDSSAPAQQVTAPVDANGAFTADVSGLREPYLLKAEWADASGTHAMYSRAPHSGNANVNEVTDSAVRRDHDGEADDSGDGAASFDSVMTQLRTVLKPLLDLYGVTNPATDDDHMSTGMSTGLRALLRDVKFSVSQGTLTVTNAQSGAVIFTGPLSNLSSGTLHPENFPTPATTPPPAATCSAFTYTPWMPTTCPSSGEQTRSVLTSSPAGCTGGTPILTQTCTPPAPPPPASTCTAFAYTAWMPAICPTSGQQTRTVLTSSPAGCTGGTPVLTQTCTPPPPPPATCTSFTYSAWAPATCPTSGQQTRTVLTSSPAGCTGGTPVLTQTCTPPPTIDGAALYGQKCAGCHGALASSNLKGKSISVSMIKSAGMTQGLTDAELQAIVTAIGP